MHLFNSRCLKFSLSNFRVLKNHQKCVCKYIKNRNWSYAQIKDMFANIWKLVIGAMLRSFFQPASLVTGFSIRILQLGYMELDPPQKTLEICD
jgi:hypothetical protein